MEQKKGLLTDNGPDALNGGKRFEIPHGTNIKSLPDAVDWTKSGEMYKYLNLKRSLVLLACSKAMAYADNISTHYELSLYP